MIGIFYISPLMSAAFTVEEIFLLMYGRQIEKRYKSLEDFEQELKDFGLDKLEGECNTGNHESCFVLEKFMEKEVNDYVTAAKNMKKIQKEREDYLLMKNFPDFLEKYFPGISQDLKAYFINVAQERFEKREKHEMKKLNKMSCRTTYDVEGLANYLECRKKALRKKYQRQKENYPNRFNWLTLSRMNEKSWSNTIRTKKRLCTHYGHALSCVDLKKMKKK